MRRRHSLSFPHRLPTGERSGVRAPSPQEIESPRAHPGGSGGRNAAESSSRSLLVACCPPPPTLRSSCHSRPACRDVQGCSEVLGWTGSWHSRRLGRRHLAELTARWNSRSTFAQSRVPESPAGHPERLSHPHPHPPPSLRSLPVSAPPPPRHFFPLRREPRAQSTALLEIQKEVLCFPGGCSLMLPLFSGTKQTFSGEGAGADSFPSPQHPAPLQALNAPSRAPGAWGGLGGLIFPGPAAKISPLLPITAPLPGSTGNRREGDMVLE